MGVLTKVIKNRRKCPAFPGKAAQKRKPPLDRSAPEMPYFFHQVPKRPSRGRRKGAFCMGHTKEDIIRLVEDEEIEFIRMQFVDIFGQLKNVANTAYFWQ